MCNYDTLMVIEEVIRDRVNNNEKFTAWDISLAVQELSKGRSLPTERHRDMKNDIHNALNQYVGNGYEKTNRPVSDRHEAFVYHPTGTDAADYVPVDRHDAGPALSSNASVALNQMLTPISVPVNINIPFINNATVGTVPDARGTVCVPNQHTNAVGLQPQDTVYVYVVDNNGEKKLCLSKDNNFAIQSSQFLTHYTVDSYKNVRITKAILERAGVQSAYGYEFETTQNEVYIKAV